MNQDFESDLRARLDRAAEGVEPRSSSRPSALKRARRRRVLNAAVATGVALSFAAGGFVGLAPIFDKSAPPPSTQPAAAPTESASLPAGEREIASGEAFGARWTLSGDGRKNPCISFTVGRQPPWPASADACYEQGPTDRSIDVMEAYGAGVVYAVGSVSDDVSSVELRVTHMQGDLETETVTPVDLHPAPAWMDLDRSFFVAPVEQQALFAWVVADPEEEAPMNRVIDLDPTGTDECTVTDGQEVAEDATSDGGLENYEPERFLTCHAEETPVEVIEGEESSGVQSIGSEDEKRGKRKRR